MTALLASLPVLRAALAVAALASLASAGGNTITATWSLSTAIPTVAIVTFTTTLASPTSAEIQFGLVTTGTTMSAPVDLAQPGYRTLLLGMKGNSKYVFRVVVAAGAETCTSEDYVLTTGAVPASVPKPTVQILNPSAHAKGFLVTSTGLAGSTAYVLDSDGAPVWWATAPTNPSRTHLSWDGKQMYMMALNVMNGAGNVARVDMDGSNAQSNLSGLSTAHHDFTAIPGGIAAILWKTSGQNAPCSIVERSDSGTLTTVVADLSAIYSSTTGFHANAIHYYASDDSYTVSDRNPNLFVKITRQGQLVWQLGGTNPKDPAKFFTGPAWQVNHGHQLLPNGNFVFFNNGNGTAPVARELRLDTITMTAASVFTYSATVSSPVLGDTQRLPNGNTLVTYSGGQIHEVDPSGGVVMKITAGSFGYVEFRETLYGPPPYR